MTPFWCCFLLSVWIMYDLLHVCCVCFNFSNINKYMYTRTQFYCKPSYHYLMNCCIAWFILTRSRSKVGLYLDLSSFSTVKVIWRPPAFMLGKTLGAPSPERYFCMKKSYPDSVGQGQRVRIIWSTLYWVTYINLIELQIEGYNFCDSILYNNGYVLRYRLLIIHGIFSHKFTLKQIKQF